MEIATSRFGPMDIEEQSLLHFPAGLLGFPEVKRYVIFDHDQDTPFKWLQAVDDPHLAFLIIDPFVVLPTYEVEIPDADLDELRITDPTQVSIFVLITIPEGDTSRMTVNLKGPVVVNGENRWGKQLVLSQTSYPTRYPLFSQPQTPV